MSHFIPDCYDCEVELLPSYAQLTHKPDYGVLYICPECLALYRVRIFSGQTPTYCEKVER